MSFNEYNKELVNKVSQNISTGRQSRKSPRGFGDSDVDPKCCYHVYDVADLLLVTAIHTASSGEIGLLFSFALAL